MVTPSEETSNEEIETVVEEPTVTTNRRSSSKPQYDFKWDEGTSSNLMVYTFKYKPPDEDWKTVTAVAPDFGTALQLAGVSKYGTVKESEVPFEEEE